VEVLAGGSSMDEIIDCLGQHWEILLNTYKPYACGVVCHPAIDGCLQLREASSRDGIDRIHLRVHPLALKLTGIEEPRGGLESKWSIYHSAAVTVVDGAAGERQYTDERVHDPAIAALRAKVTAEGDASLRDDEAHVAITLSDDRVLEAHIAHATGSTANPLTDRGLEAKFRALAETVLPETRISALIDKCWRVDELENVAELARLATP